MSSEKILKIDLLNRRDVLRGLGGLLVAFTLPGGRNAEAQRYGAPIPVKPNAYIHIDSDNNVTFVITKVEMGQGTVTSLSQILADELDCDWNCVRTEFAPVDPSCYGPMQGVFGSTEYPYAVDAAAQGRRGGAPDADGSCGTKVEYRCDASTAQSKALCWPTGSASAMAVWAEAAAKLAVPANIRLKDAKDFKLIGTPVKRLDTRDKI